MEISMTPEGDLHLPGHPERVARSMAAWHVSGDLIEMGIKVMMVSGVLAAARNPAG